MRHLQIKLVFLSFIFSYSVCYPQNYLFNNRKTNYVIVLANDASTTERYAAKELQTYIKKVSKVDIRINNNANTTSNNYIFVGWTSTCNSPKYVDDDESFTYKTIGKNIYIFGGKDRGTMYGVFAFLEQQFGIHWYTSDYTFIPNLKQYEIKNLNHSEKPAFKSRLNLYFNSHTKPEWSVHNLINSDTGCWTGEYGKISGYWGCHSFGQLISPDKYFNEHPEYFSMLNGKRINNAQLCLSNKSMRRELIKNLKNTIKEWPDFWCYDVSQNDNNSPCECSECKKLIQKYGGQSGAMIWFVNQVADEIKKTYPNKYIGTFAYQYTREAPTSSIKPNNNVVVRLCDTECCMAHPLNECKQNSEFIKDLNNWKKITKNLYIWDYTTGFLNYLLPFPNFKSLAANYKLFAKSNVVGVLEEGQYESEWGEFSELKEWIISKLMWNPEQDVDSLTKQFIKDYYGNASDDILSYYNLCNKQVTDNIHFTIHIDSNSELYDDGFLKEATDIIDRALQHADKNQVVQKRVKRIAAQIYYLKFKKNIINATANGSYRKLKNIIDSDNTYLREPHYTLDMILKDTGYK